MLIASFLVCLQKLEHRVGMQCVFSGAPTYTNLQFIKGVIPCSAGYATLNPAYPLVSILSLQNFISPTNLHFEAILGEGAAKLRNPVLSSVEGSAWGSVIPPCIPSRYSPA